MASQYGKRTAFGGRRGIALLSVLWVLMLLGLMAATFTRTARTETKLARNLLEIAEAEALTTAGLHFTVARLVQPVTEGGWSLDGQIHSVRFHDGEFRVRIADEAAKIDVNVATADLLRALFVAAGQEGRDAAALADAVVDFRDPDHLRGLNGAEDDDYAAAGLPYDAKDGPIEFIEELNQVIGMPDGLYARIAPVLTVHTRQRVPSQITAPPLVIAAMRGTTLGQQSQGEIPAATGQSPEDAGAAASVAPGREAKTPGSEAEIDDAEAASGARSRLGLYAVRVEGRTPGGALIARDVVLLVARRGSTQSQILQWREARPALFAATLAGETPL